MEWPRDIDTVEKKRHSVRPTHVSRQSSEFETADLERV